MDEGYLWGTIRYWCNRNRVFARRIEHSVELGWPDTYIGKAWVELKATGTRWAVPKFRKGQVAWAVEAEALGERCFTAIIRPGGEIDVARTTTFSPIDFGISNGVQFYAIGANIDQMMDVILNGRNPICRS